MSIKNKLIKLIELIDDNKIKSINDWFWNDYKNLDTTIALVEGFIYAIDKNKNKKVIDSIKNILAPKGKSGPLEYKDIVSFLYNNKTKKEFEKIISILLKNKIPFELKDGAVAYSFLTDPTLQKLTKQYPPVKNLISKYMKKDEKEKIIDTLLKSDNYDDIEIALSTDLFKVENTSIRAFKKSDYYRLARELLKVKNKEIRRKYLKEHIFKKGVQVENLYDVILEHYKAGTYNDAQLIDLMGTLSWDNNSNGSATDLIYYLLSKNKFEVIKKIAQNFDGDIFNSVIRDATFRTSKDNEKLNIEKWILKFGKLVNPNSLIDIYKQADTDFKTKYLEIFPEMLNKLPKKDLPQNIKDIFIF